MTLTAQQLQWLRNDLQTLAGIEYEDVLNELLDHYATLTEQRMTTGLSFDDASKWAWADLGSGAGIQQIQDNYVANVTKQVKTQHLAIVKSYFRWPTFIITALVVVLVYLVVPILPYKITLTVIFILGITPTGLVSWAHRKSLDRQSSASPIVFQGMQKSGVLSMNVVNMGFNFFSFSDSTWQTSLYLIPATLISLLLLLYTASFVQLFRQRFILRTA